MNVLAIAYLYCVSCLDLADTLSLRGKIPSSHVHPHPCFPAFPSLRNVHAAVTEVVAGPMAARTPCVPLAFPLGNAIPKAY